MINSSVQPVKYICSSHVLVDSWDMGDRTQCSGNDNRGRSLEVRGIGPLLQYYVEEMCKI